MVMKKQILAVIVAILVGPLLSGFAFDSEVNDATGTLNQREERLAWWREAKFGMFIHWGLYSQLAGEWKGGYYSGIGEWIMYKARIPIADYENVAHQFNPTHFDAEAWAQLAQDAGMKYVVLTSKHHDGFAMFGSQADKFNIVEATPFARDPVKELAAACAKRGLKFGVYYSQAQDWSAPGGAIWKGQHEADPIYDVPQWDSKQAGNFDTYFETKAIPQVRELLSHYGPISLVWFDTPLGVMNAERSAKLEKTVRELQPHCLISGRLGGNFQSDYESEGDNQIPDLARAGAWETPATLNDTWGFKKKDHHWKAADNVIFKLVDIVSKGGNYLLNVGPDGAGVIPQPSQDTLRGVGRWLKINGEAIYGAGRTPFGEELGEIGKIQPEKQSRVEQQWRCEVCGANQKRPTTFVPPTQWRCTAQPGKLFIHIFDWPKDGKFQLPAVKAKIAKAYLLADPNHVGLPVTQSLGGVAIALPAQAPDLIASVVCLEVIDK